MTSRIVAALLALVASGAPASGQNADYVAFSRLIVDNFSHPHGRLTEVSPLAWCATWAPAFQCEGAERDLSEFAGVFAEDVGARMRTREGFADRPPCEWSDEGDSAEAGLSGNLGRPAIEGDKAEVYLAISCRSERSFGMVTLFWFERGPGGAWAFVKSQVTAIT